MPKQPSDNSYDNNHSVSISNELLLCSKDNFLKVDSHQSYFSHKYSVNSFVHSKMEEIQEEGEIEDKDSLEDSRSISKKTKSELGPKILLNQYTEDDLKMPKLQSEENLTSKEALKFKNTCNL